MCASSGRHPWCLSPDTLETARCNQGGVNAMLASLKTSTSTRTRRGSDGLDKGFDFLGYHFSPTGVTVAQATVLRFAARAARLYEQEQREPQARGAWAHT